MVKIIDITEEKEREKQQAKLEWELAKECFKKNRVYLGDRTILVHSSRRMGKPVMFKATGKPRMTIYDEEILPAAVMFAREYEEHFPSEQEFKIKRNY